MKKTLVVCLIILVVTTGFAHAQIKRYKLSSVDSKSLNDQYIFTFTDTMNYKIVVNKFPVLKPGCWEQLVVGNTYDLHLKETLFIKAKTIDSTGRESFTGFFIGREGMMGHNGFVFKPGEPIYESPQIEGHFFLLPN